jgi:polyisoprenoid-binding protein YceI
MKRLFSWLAALLLSATALQAQEAPKWKIDQSHTSVNFVATHFFSDVPGSFHTFSGDFRIDPENMAASTLHFTVQVKSVDTDNEKRDQHLRGEDFFHVSEYPTITFRSSEIEQTGKNQYKVYGKLSIREVSKEVALPVTVKGVMDHPMMKNTKILGLSIDTTLDRTEYNVGVGDWAATAVVGDEVEVDIDMELNRKY